MTILPYYWRNNYGTELRYIGDADQAAAWFRITGRVTLRDGDLLALEALGVSAIPVPASNPRYGDDPLPGQDRPD